MEITDFFGYLGALIIGISLGLIGGGGSILAVPILAYLFYIDEKTATAYSLFIVGISILQGPHHSAQKSTKTGISELITLSSKLSLVISKIFSLIIYSVFNLKLPKT